MRRSSSTKDRIFEQACLLFAEHGYKGVSARQIAAAVHVRHRTVQYHYRDKKELYTQVFHKLYDLDNVLTYDVLLQREPSIFDTPEGKAYAIQRVVFSFFYRHAFIPEEWKRKLIHRELLDRSPIFWRLMETELNQEAEKMLEFYYRLRPDGPRIEALYWSHLPYTQALYYFLADGFIENHFERHIAHRDGNATELPLSLSNPHDGRKLPILPALNHEQKSRSQWLAVQSLDRDTEEELNKFIVKNTVKTMISLLNLPVPPMLD